MYGTHEYWDLRYAKNTKFFDWYCTYDDLAPIFIKYISTGNTIAEVGCGTSTLSFKLNSSFDAIVNAYDISLKAVELCKAFKGEGWPGLSFEVAEAAALPVEDNSLDVIVDKGCLDSILCGGDTITEYTLYMRECFRCLKANGFLLIISCGQRDERELLFKTTIKEFELPVEVEIENIFPSKEKTPMLYVLHKPH